MYKIYKIGGIALEMNDIYKELKRLLQMNNEHYFIIISALKNVSRLLKSASEFAVDGKKIPMEDSLQEIFEIHESFISNYISSGDIKFNNLLAKYESTLRKLLTSVFVTGHLSNRTSDLILSVGEDLLLDIIKIDLDANPLVSTIDSREIIRTDSNFGQAMPDIEASCNLINTKINALKTHHFITAGFVAADDEGNTTTMGFESSNLTAMLIAKAVGTDEIRMITDVSGIYEADPKIFPKAKLINEISYDNAIKAADYGLKLFYAPMLKQASESDVKIYYSNQIVQNNQFTIISKNLKDNNSLIIYKENNIVQPYDSQEMINNKHNILEFIDQSYHLLYENDKNIYFCTHNSLINNNHYSMLIMLYHEIKLIIDCIYENNFDLNEIKIFMPEKDVIHLITRKDIALKIGNILLERM